MGLITRLLGTLCLMTTVSLGSALLAGKDELINMAGALTLGTPRIDISPHMTSSPSDGLDSASCCMDLGHRLVTGVASAANIRWSGDSAISGSNSCQLDAVSPR